MSQVTRALLTTTPPEGDFVLRGTVPLPKGGIPLKRKPYGFRVKGPLGEHLKTQIETCIRATGGGDLATVMEVLAFVPAGMVTPGVPVDFELEESPSETHVVQADHDHYLFLQTPWQASFRVWDTNRDQWAASLSGVQGTPPVVERAGPVMTTVRTGNALRRVKGPGAVPHLGGVHVWWSLLELDIIELVIDWTTGVLPAIGDVYFDRAELVLAPGWRALPFWDEPALGGVAVPADGWSVRTLIAGRGAEANLMDPMRSKLWRLVLHRDNPEALAAAKRWVSRQGTFVPKPSASLWSWQNMDCAGFQPAGCPMPSGLASVSKVEATAAREFQEVADGDPDFNDGEPPMYHVLTKLVAYGGMTSGEEVEAWAGTDVLDTGSPDGFRAKELELARWWCLEKSIYGPNGEPARVEDYLVEGRPNWTIYNQRPKWDKEGPFDFRNAVGLPLADGWLEPAYKERLVGTRDVEWEQGVDPVDDQHRIRPDEPATFLLWAANDPVARFFLRKAAELVRLSNFEGPGGSYAALLQATIDDPGTGGNVGRADAWRINVVTNAYCSGDDGFRERSLAWLVTVGQILKLRQMPNGLIGGTNSGKGAKHPPLPDPPEYWVTRSNEECFLAFALMGLSRSVYGHPDNQREARDAVARLCLGLWDFAWKPGTNGPMSHVPTRKIGGPPFTSRIQMPEGYVEGTDIDSFQIPIALCVGQLAGAKMVRALRAWTGQSNVGAALEVVLATPDKDLGPRGGLLGLTQALYYH